MLLFLSFTFESMSGEKQPIRIELPTKFEMGTVNSYLFTGPIPTLIDTGEKSEASWDALKSGLSKAGLSIKDIQRIIITHAHVDHIGMAARIADASGARVLVSELVYPWAAHLDKMQKIRWNVITNLLTEITNQEDSPLHKGFAKFFNNYKDYWDPIPEHVLETFKIGDSLSFGGGDWEVMHAPGHCINQSCFYNKATNELFAADMLLRIASTPVIDATLEDETKRTAGLFEMRKTLNRFKQLELTTVYPGHYDPIYNGQELIQKQLDRIEFRITQTYEFFKGGPKSFFEVLEHMYKGRISGPAIPMMIGYLDVLLTEKRIISHQTEKGLIYSISDN